jgi:hypothetical protein
VPLTSLITAAALVLALPTQVGPAPSAGLESATSSEVSYALEAMPGGVLTAPNEVTWPDGTVLVVVPDGRAVDVAGSRVSESGRVAAPSVASNTCPSGKFCAHSAFDGTGTRLEFQTCPSTNSLAAMRVVKSVSNARTRGTVTAQDGSTVIATATAGTMKNITKAVDRLVCR